MSDRTVEWNGNTYDLDPLELDMLENDEIAKRGGPKNLKGLGEMQALAWKSLFWAQDWRRDPNVAFGDYRGPTFRVIISAREKYLVEHPEPAERESGKAPTGTDGSQPSPTSSDTPPTSSTP